ncbi:hypothetical protein MRB53_037101 [Persea americana]|nr:hypothetical protein MRB53_037101 [Persea americana]
MACAACSLPKLGGSMGCAPEALSICWGIGADAMSWTLSQLHRRLYRGASREYFAGSLTSLRREPVPCKMEERKLDDLVVSDDGQTTAHPGLTSSQARSLYFSHALSTWNVRMYEFAAVRLSNSCIYAAMLMVVHRGIAVDLASLLLSSSIGSAIDNSSTRLRPLLLSISANRACVMTACCGWYILVGTSSFAPGNASSTARTMVFACTVSFGVVERLSGVANRISMERDWVPTLAVLERSESDGSEYTLTHLNAVMRRIDLVCKLISPIVISAIITATSTSIGVLIVACGSAICWGLEIISANHVWRTNSILRASKPPKLGGDTTSSIAQPRWSAITTLVKAQASQMRAYFSTDVWMPSLALAFCYFTALSYESSMITFLLASGYSLLLITSARVLGSVLEVSSTFIAPYSIRRLANSRHVRRRGEDEDRLMTGEEDGATIDADIADQPRSEHSVGLARTALWGVTLNLTSLVSPLPPHSHTQLTLAGPRRPRNLASRHDTLLRHTLHHTAISISVLLRPHRRLVSHHQLLRLPHPLTPRNLGLRHCRAGNHPARPAEPAVVIRGDRILFQVAVQAAAVGRDYRPLQAGAVQVDCAHEHWCHRVRGGVACLLGEEAEGAFGALALGRRYGEVWIDLDIESCIDVHHLTI